MKAQPETIHSTESFARRFADSADGNFRVAQGLTVSSIGIGTYLGNADAETDKSYVEAITRYVELGGNVIDTAANYRFQRSERNIGDALDKLREREFSREELVICTKGGFLPFDNEPPANVRNYFEDTFAKKGIATIDDLVGGSHCMTPSYLQSQIDQSLQNMKLEFVDVYYIHNPETQLSQIDADEFEMRLAKAFAKLEENRAAGKIKYYGVATWNGFRLAPNETGFHSLEKMFRIAAQVGGVKHGFRFIQLPFNLTMPEAFVFGNQQLKGSAVSTIDAARDLGISVMCSASLLQGKLSQWLPTKIREGLGSLGSDALTSLQFARSTPGVSTALVGMSKLKHVEENLSLAKIPVASRDEYEELFG
jgi:aryl-alcohol dehydrogenase-like predicted oxidoreductase